MFTLQEVPTAQIENAIRMIRTRKISPQFFFYIPSEPSMQEKELTANPILTISATLPELYRELARRAEEGTWVIQEALREFED